MSLSTVRPIIAVLFLSACTATTARESQPTEAPRDPAPPAVMPPAQLAPAAQALTRIQDPSLVCMVNDRFMGVPQIPVPVEGKTYFGCCAMCKGRLEKDAHVRLGVDPVSKQPVDKATAILARTAGGEVLYFENEDSLREYSRTL